MRRWIWVLLGVIIIGGGLYAWASTARTSGGARQAAVQQRMYIPVERSTIVRTLSYSGSLEPAQDETLTAGSAGWIKEVRVAKGDRVKAGDVIARLDDTEAQLELMRARREYEQAKMESPAIVVEERRLALLSAERRLSGTAVTAPFDGVVVDLYVREGDSVTSQAQIARLVDVSSYKVTLTVDQNDLVNLAVGQDVFVRPDAFRGMVLVGRIEEIGFLPTSTDGTTTYPVVIRIDASQAEEAGFAGLRPGMSVEAEIVIASAENVLVVPIASIVEAGRQQLVTRVGPDGTEEVVEIETGLSDGLYVEVRSGLSEGDLIVANNYLLFEQIGAQGIPGGRGGPGGAFAVPGVRGAASIQRVISGR
ncbi:MAG: efflux RND transporter periplasmic adaptor subunit [Clostridia bacterium]